MFDRLTSDEMSIISHDIKVDELSYERIVCFTGVLQWREVPWIRFATSGPVWALIVANFCMDWGLYTLLTNIPTFYKEVLLFDITQVSVATTC